jgi:hypothetical protein
MVFPRYDSNLPWKEKKKILEAEIAEKKKPLLKIHRAAKKKNKVKHGR